MMRRKIDEEMYEIPDKRENEEEYYDEISGIKEPTELTVIERPSTLTVNETPVGTPTKKTRSCRNILIFSMIIVILVQLAATVYLFYFVVIQDGRANGNWSEWKEWQACSVTCGIGLHSRTRTCTSPRPSGLGDYCVGHGIEDKLCKTDDCTETPVAFNAYLAYIEDDITREKSAMKPVIFRKVLLNEGEAYDNETGMFVAPFSGIYQFNCHLCLKKKSQADYALTVDGHVFVSGEYRTPADVDDGKCTSFSAVTYVQEKGNVSVISNAANDERDFLSTLLSFQTIGNYLYQNNNDWNSFSGVLIQKM